MLKLLYFYSVISPFFIMLFSGHLLLMFVSLVYFGSLLTSPTFKKLAKECIEEMNISE